MQQTDIPRTTTRGLNAGRHWERRGGTSRNVTFPARQCDVNGESRSFALLRPVVDTTAQNAVRDLILEAYAEYEEAEATASA
jgi:hypothetical protein